jgi:hypothetical protein
MFKRAITSQPKYFQLFGPCSENVADVIRFALPGTCRRGISMGANGYLGEQRGHFTTWFETLKV